ncbi:hypothetical protein SDC9_206350 [bioreactor metagenome]|uniref:Uncharacterized protein n=1 Tax=bioreactor metagenome TaxID=1076179 RepID=A0A645J696_9ZZZZ
MDNEYALLFIRGERPVMDKKYNILGHPNLKYTEDGGAEPYVHIPCPDYSIADLDFAVENPDDIEILEETEIVL